MILAPGVFIAGVVIFLIVIWDAFEAIILPRRVTRKFRLARFYYQFTWTTWRIYARLIPSKKRRESFLGFYGPISLLFLIAVWAAGLILSFAMMQYGAGSAVNLSGTTPSFYTDLYLSGTTFFTLGLGDVVPRSGVSRFLVVVESGFGFGFLAAVIGYLPFVYSSFADRETEIVLLDARRARLPLPANSSCVTPFPEVTKRCAICSRIGNAGRRNCSKAIFLIRCSRITVRSTITSRGLAPSPPFWTRAHSRFPAWEMFAPGRRSLLRDRAARGCRPLPGFFGRACPARPGSPTSRHVRLIRETLEKHGTKLAETPEPDQKLAELRKLYEPYVTRLPSASIRLCLPGFREKIEDNWQTTAWAKTTNGTAAAALVHDDHF